MKDDFRHWCLRFKVAAGHRGLMAMRVEETAHVAVFEQDLWLRVSVNEKLIPVLQKLPFTVWYEEHRNGDLVPLGAALPVERLPLDLDWQPLAQWLRPGQAKTLLPAKATGDCIPLQLRRETSRMETANLMQVKFSSLAQWVEWASQSRLEPLEWMADSLGLVIVRGNPLPSIPGEYMHCKDGVAHPLGYRVYPTMTAAAIRSLVQSGSTDLVLINNRGAYLVPEEFFVPLTRSGVRMSREHFCLLDEQ